MMPESGQAPGGPRADGKEEVSLDRLTTYGAAAHTSMLAHAVMQTGDAVMITSALGTIEFVNPAFENHSGYSAEEVLGQTPALVKSDAHPPEFFASLWEAILKGEVFRAVFTNRHKSGALYYEEKTITPIRDANQEITHFVSTGRDITARILADERLEFLASHDALTRTPNRCRFMDCLGQAIGRCRRDGAGLTLLLIDLDRFKRINDSLGHGIGDQVLTKVPERLRSVVGERPLIARLGGDEFIILVEGDARPAMSDRIAEALLDSFAQPFQIGDRTLYTGISIGIATYPEDGEDIESLVRHADIAMYQAKSSGRSTYVNFSSVMEAEMLEDISIDVSLRSALDNAEFEIHYQPIICPEKQQTVAVEALLRWHSAQHGTVPPARFIPMLEESGLIGKVGYWVLQTACAQIKALSDQLPYPLILAVNLSGRQFRDGNLVGDVRKLLSDTGLPATQLELEITESILIEDAPTAAKTLDALAALGVRLAIDDFGTGYSSLSYLRRFPINTLKIDRSFVIEMDNSPDAVSIVKAIINLADNLGLEVVAEGVENPGQLAQLAEFGCSKVQGYWFSPPVTLAELTARQLAATPERTSPCRHSGNRTSPHFSFELHEQP
ncbi:MAG: EAL domain-containing protein [Dechloromonas sp.]|nr:MAG: EAL domain-containing protein [Dechloromonas sp.]